jgi:hypothetical protein
MPGVEEESNVSILERSHEFPYLEIKRAFVEIGAQQHLKAQSPKR